MPAEPSPGKHVLPPGWAPRFYEERDEEGVLRLLPEAFDSWPEVTATVPAAEHFRWKMASPAHGSRQSLVAEIDGRVVGFQAYWLQQVRIGGRLLLAKQSMDFCVHPDFQRMGIRTRMKRMAEHNPRRNFQVLFGLTSGHPAMRKLERNAVRANLPGPTQLANSIEALVRHGPASRRPLEDGDGAWTLRRVPAFDRRIDAFWEQAAQPFVAIVERRREYLNWRYADARAGDFSITVALHDDAILGYIVSCVSRGRGYIADVLALPGRSEVAGALIGRAVADLDNAGLDTIECWSPRHHPYRDLWQAWGFSHRRREVPISMRHAREYADDMPFRDDPKAAVHITIGDTDLV
ncbi:MAG: GNAT family N-acetyltransferase [Chloroflexi bacterium]|nr:GNAT family N-acetyltransferase [Chloroflexota bacterium]